MEYPNHIHAPEDGRGLRKVFVNGKLAPYCFYADTEKGIAKVFKFPFAVNKHLNRVVVKTLRGVVTVEPDHGD